MALKFLTKTGYVSVEAKVARLTAKGLEAQAAAPGAPCGQSNEHGQPRRLRKAVGGVLDQRAALSEGLRPYPDGWRAGSATSSRRTPSSTTRPDVFPTTRWCSTAAGGRTAAD